MALDLDEISERLRETQERIDGLLEKQAARKCSPDEMVELTHLQETRDELTAMGTDDDLTELIGDALVETAQDFLGEYADTGLQDMADMLRADPDMKPQDALISVIARVDPSVDAQVARDCLVNTGYRGVDDTFPDKVMYEKHSMERQETADATAKAVASSVPDGYCARYLEAKGDLSQLEAVLQRIDSNLDAKIIEGADRIPLLQERANVAAEIEGRVEGLHSLGAEVFAPEAKAVSTEESMQRFDVARLEDLAEERDTLKLSGDEKAAQVKQEEYSDLLESLKMQADRDPDGFSAKYISAKEEFETAQSKSDNSDYMLASEQRELKADYLEKYENYKEIVSETRYFVDGAKEAQAKDEVERNGVKGDVTPRMDARAIIDFKVFELSYDRKNGDDFLVSKEILQDKVESKYQQVEGIAKAAPDSLCAEYVTLREDISGKKAEISALEDQYKSEKDSGADRTELLHKIDDLKAELSPLEGKLHDIELRAGSIIESAKSDSEVDQDRLIAKVYALDKEIQDGGLDNISYGANLVDIDNTMLDIRAIAKDDPHGPCADFAREFDGRRELDTEYFNAKQDAFSDTKFSDVDSHQEVRDIEVRWENYQEHIDRLGSEAQLGVEGLDTVGRIETPPDPVDNEGAQKDVDTSSPNDADANKEDTPYKKAQAEYDSIKDKYLFRNFFVCADRLKLNIEAYKAGQNGDKGRPVTGGDIAMNIIELTRSNVWESILEVKVRDFFDKKYPAHSAQDVEKGPNVHTMHVPKDKVCTDSTGIFHDDGFLERKDPRSGVDKGSELNPGFGRYWGADLTREVKGGGRDITTSVRYCGRGFTDSVVLNGTMETIKVPPVRLVEMGENHYLIDPFGKTLYSNVTTDSKDLEIQQAASKPYFKDFDISQGRFGSQLIEAGAAAKGMSTDDYKAMLTDRCKQDYADAGLRFFAAHGDYLENRIIPNLKDDISHTKDKIEFLRGEQLDKEAERSAITAETPNADAKGKRLDAEIKSCISYEEKLQGKLEELTGRLDRVEKTLSAYDDAKVVARSRDLDPEVKFSVVLRGEVTGQGKLDNVSYGLDRSIEERIEDALEKFGYKYEADRAPRDVATPEERGPKADPKDIEAKRSELIREYGFNQDKIRAMDMAVEKLGRDRAEGNYRPGEWMEYDLYREDLDKYIAEKEAEADAKADSATVPDGNPVDTQDSNNNKVGSPDDAKGSQPDTDKANAPDRAEAHTTKEEQPGKEQRVEKPDEKPGGSSRVETRGTPPDTEKLNAIADKIGIDPDKLYTMAIMDGIYGDSARDQFENLEWDKFDQYKAELAAEEHNPDAIADGDTPAESAVDDETPVDSADQGETLSDYDQQDTAERIPEVNRQNPAVIEESKNDVILAQAGEQRIDGQPQKDPAAANDGQSVEAASEKEEWTHGEIKDYGDVVSVDGLCMNHEQLDEYVKGPMSVEDIGAVIDRFIEAGLDSPDSFSFREDFLEPCKFRFDVSDVMDAFADKLRDVKEDAENGDPPSQGTIDMMVDCLCSIRDEVLDNFTEGVTDVLNRIETMFIDEPGLGGAVADKFLDSINDVVTPVLSGFEPYDSAQVNLIDEIADRLDMFRNEWDNADVSGFVDAALNLDSIFNGFADMLTDVGNSFANGEDIAIHDIDAGMQIPDTELPAADTETPQMPDVEIPGMNNDIDIPGMDLTEGSPKANAGAEDIFNPDQYTEPDTFVGDEAARDALDDLDKAADSLNDLGDMLRGVEQISDSMSDLDRDDYMNYLGGE